MITNGFPSANAMKTEIVDVANGVTCSDIADFPVAQASAVGAYLGDTLVVCGGWSSGNQESSKKCFRLTNSVWEEFVSMKEKRGYTAAIIYNHKLHGRQIHVFGGWSGSSMLQTSETITEDGKVSQGPNLLTAIYFHSMTKINGTVSILSGGRTNTNDYSAKTWYYNHDTEAFTSGPDLMEGRRYHGSALNVDKVTKSKIVVVTGGWRQIGNVRLDSTEMLINGQWQTGTIQCRKQKKMF